MSRRNLFLAAVAGSLAMAGLAVAQMNAEPPAAPGTAEPSRGGLRMAACRDDLQRLCSASDDRGGERRRCLVRNREQLTPACADMLAEVEQARSAGRGEHGRGERGRGGRPLAACRADMRSLCSDVEPGRGARLHCLTENQTKVSPACGTALAELRASREERRSGRQGGWRAEPPASAPPAAATPEAAPAEPRKQ
jgi:hypothetical protein